MYHWSTCCGACPCQFAQALNAASFAISSNSTTSSHTNNPPRPSRLLSRALHLPPTASTSIVNQSANLFHLIELSRQNDHSPQTYLRPGTQPITNHPQPFRSLTYYPTGQRQRSPPRPRLPPTSSPRLHPAQVPQARPRRRRRWIIRRPRHARPARRAAGCRGGAQGQVEGRTCSYFRQ